MKRSYKAVLIILLQLVFLSGIIGIKYYTLHFGTAVLLKSSPVDPWDMFRGEYVRLTYDISRIEGDPLGTGNGDLEDQTVFVVLQKGDKYWIPVRTSFEVPPVESGQVFIKGKLSYFDSRSSQYNITYGIETYFVEEGAGGQLQRRDVIDVTVRVDRFGNAVIEKIL